MKKLVLALAALLMLTGCAETQPTEPTAAPTTAATEPAETEPAGLYLPESPMERATEGAVRTYELERGKLTGLSMLGGRLLAVSDSRELHLLEGERAVPVRVREPETPEGQTADTLYRTAGGTAYYDAVLGAVVTLDENLISGASYVLPAGVTQPPLLAEDRSALYYVTEKGVGAMDLQQGTARLLRQEETEILHLDGLLFDNTVLQYTRLTADGAEQVCFIDPRTGSLLDTARFSGTLTADGDRFAAALLVPDAIGAEPWFLSGSREGAEIRLIPEKGWGNPVLLPEGRVLLQRRTKVGMELSCVELQTGNQISRVLLPQQRNMMTLACADGDVLWLSAGETERFFRWEMTPSETEPSAVAVPYFSLSHPDEAAMEPLTARMEALEERFHIRLTAEPALERTEGVSYDRMPDYLPVQTDRTLKLLEIALERLPEDFLRTVGKKSGDRLTIRLTDRFDPAFPAKPGTGAIDLTNGRTLLEADMSPDVGAIFYHELWHILEVELRNDSDELTRWDRLNPEGFSYTGEVEEDPERYAGATADGYGMVSAREDRAQLFSYACLPDQADRFTRPVLQEKLRFLAELLREHFEPEGEPIWEQYLIEGPGE